MSKYIFVTGGVVSGLGKGITAASMAMLIKAQGYTVDMIKFDPYFNVDSLYLSPYQHGEVFVTDDGGEGDLVLGHYERFLDQNLSENSNITSGKIYSAVIRRERDGAYDGESVQVVPHITDEIKRTLYTLNTKPTQNSVKELQNIGIQPDIIVCRSDYRLDDAAKKKLSLFCNVERNGIIESVTTDNLYQVPLRLHEQNFEGVALNKLKMEEREPKLDAWRDMCARAEAAQNSDKKLRVAVVGKYVEKVTAYQSVTDAITTAGLLKNEAVEISLVSSADVENDPAVLDGFDGILIASGFGVRGFDGKIAAAKYAREKDVPCLLIGLGAQAGLIEFARDVCNMTGANTQEFDDKTPYGVVCSIDPPMLKKGAFPTVITPGTYLSRIYGAQTVSERHRHRFDFSATYEQLFLRNGLVFSAHSPTGVPEAFEIPTNKFFIGTVYNPEYRSRLLSTHPLFAEFIKVISK